MSQILQYPTLILNKNWNPIRFTTVKDAIILVSRGSAYIVEPATYQLHDLMSWNEVSILYGTHIKSQRLNLAKPEVIVLSEYGGVMFDKAAVFSRRNLVKRDNYMCQYCGIELMDDELTIDHVIARSKGGSHSWTNCVVACFRCNSKKGDYELQEIGMSLLKQPHVPSVNEVTMNMPRHIRCDSWTKFLS